MQTGLLASTKMDFNLKTIQAFWLLDLISVDDLPNVAAEALAQGFESKSLVELAGLLSVDVQEASSLFQKSLQELGLDKMQISDALKYYAKETSNRILNSEVTPIEGARDIWRVARKAQIKGFHDLDPFIYAASEVEDRPADKDFFEKAIKDEAVRWSTFV